MRKLSAAGQLLLLVSLGLVILGSEQRIRERAGLAGAEKKQERTEETARRYYELYENIWKDLEYFPNPPMEGAGASGDLREQLAH